MGYCMDMTESHFYIHFDKKAAALAAIKSLKGKETIRDSSGAHFSWVDPKVVEQARTLEEALAEWSYEATVDEAGSITDLDFTGEKSGDEDHLFKAIAPFVRGTSYLSFRGEDGAHWRWYFNGETCMAQAGTVTYG